MLSFLVLNQKKSIILDCYQSWAWRISWEKKTAPRVHQTLMFREKSYNMESFGKQNKKLGNSLVRTKWVWRRNVPLELLVACTWTLFCPFCPQNPHLRADPTPGWNAAPHLHHAFAQPAFPVIRVHLQTPAHLLQSRHHPRSERRLGWGMRSVLAYPLPQVQWLWGARLSEPCSSHFPRPMTRMISGFPS